MKALVEDWPAVLRQTASESAPAVTEIPVGQIVEVAYGPLDRWTLVQLGRGRVAYASPGANLLPLTRVTPVGAVVTVHETADTSSPVAFRIAPGQQMLLGREVEAGGGRWVQAYNLAGYGGFAVAGASTRRVPAPALQRARQAMATGAILLIVGVAATVGTLALAENSNGSGVFVLAWGPVVAGFGLVASGANAYRRLRGAPS